jgi:hypothetical protein
MSRVFENPFQVYMLADGVTVNSAGYLRFLEPGAGSTLKAIYADANLTVQLTNPIQLTAAGRLLQPIHIDGNYKVEIQDSLGTKYDEVDNYEYPDLEAQFGDWVSTLTYNVNDFSRASNGKYYQSLGSGNTGNEPSASPTKWEEKAFLGIYNSTKLYVTDNIVQFGDSLWVALENIFSDNIGQEPALGSSFWRSFSTAKTIAGFAGASLEYRLDTADGVDHSLDVSSQAQSDFHSIGPTDSGADITWDDLDDLPSSASMAIVAFYYELTFTGAGSLALITLDSYAKPTYSAALDTLETQIVKESTTATTTGVGGIVGVREFNVPLDSLNRFSWRFDRGGSATYPTPTFDLVLKGYKI